MTKPINIESIEKITGRPWSEWVKDLDETGARGLTHTELARVLKKKLEGKVDSHEWWAQGVAVAYEQHTGKRVPGQLANGLFEIAVSKIVAKSRRDLFPQVVDWLESQPDLKGHDFTRSRTSETPKRSYWRCDFADGSRFVAAIEDSGEKSKLAFLHTAIPTKQDADEWREFWRGVADQVMRTK